MNYFRTMPTVLRAQREELEAAHRDLCQDVSELSGVIQQLGSMSGFGEVIQVLRRAQQTGVEQEAKLRRSARVLEQAAGLYARTEQQNIDGASCSILRNAKTFVMESSLELVISPVNMIPDAGAFFGMEVLIPQRDGEGG